VFSYVSQERRIPRTSVPRDSCPGRRCAQQHVAEVRPGGIRRRGVRHNWTAVYRTASCRGDAMLARLHGG